MPELIAYHEAGHALMAVLLGGKVRHVTIEPDDDDGPSRLPLGILFLASKQGVLIDFGLPNTLAVTTFGTGAAGHEQ